MLPDPERQVFEAIFYGGATYSDAAQLLSVNERTVRRRMNRARLHLARTYFQTVNSQHEHGP